MASSIIPLTRPFEAVRFSNSEEIENKKADIAKTHEVFNFKDMRFHIALFLDIKALGRLSRVCKVFNDTINKTFESSNLIWERYIFSATDFFKMQRLNPNFKGTIVEDGDPKENLERWKVVYNKTTPEAAKTFSAKRVVQNFPLQPPSPVVQQNNSMLWAKVAYVVKKIAIVAIVIVGSLLAAAGIGALIYFAGVGILATALVGGMVFLMCYGMGAFSAYQTKFFQN